MIGVYYCRTDDTPGYKEYTCVVLEALKTANGSAPMIEYSGTIYDYNIAKMNGDPIPLSYNYRVKFEVPMNMLDGLCEKAGTSLKRMVGWIEGPLKDQVLQYWKVKRQRN